MASWSAADRAGSAGLAGRPAPLWGGGPVVWSLRSDRPLISPPGDLDAEAPLAEWGDDQPAVHVGGIRLVVARRTERHQPVEIEVRASLGALDDMVDLEGAPAATGLTPPAGAILLVIQPTCTSSSKRLGS